MVQQDKARRRWDRRAPRYDAGSDRMERLTIGDSREWIASRARGRTLEVAIGTARNLRFYPDTVELTGIDLSPGMLAVTRRSAGELGRAIELHEGDAARLPFPDRSFDTVVCTLAVCSVPDRNAAIAEMYRVLRPGGRLLLLDHLEHRWLRGRPADLALRRGFLVEERQSMRLGCIDRFAARKPAAPS
jgi:ubiquinone/menaquinone biosynthesis C-methylase UbiE